MGKIPIISAFCGTGKTYMCRMSYGRLVEFECWKYSNSHRFPVNIIKCIISVYEKIDGIFISTNPMVLNELPEKMNVTMVYPELSLKDEYIERFVRRGSSDDFISTLSKYWEPWIIEAMGHNWLRHIVLKTGQYIESVLPELLTSRSTRSVKSQVGINQES